MADFFLLPFLVAAKQEHINGFTIRNEKGFRLILDKPMVLHADGEYCADVTSGISVSGEETVAAA